MNTTHFLSQITAGTFVLGILATNALAHQGPQANAAYVGDSRGHVVTDGSGHCVRTSTWTEALAIAECEGRSAPVQQTRAPTPPLAPVPIAKMIPKPAPQLITLKAGSLFDVNKATLKPAGRAELDALVTRLRGVSSTSNISVVGHTDSQGSADYNQQLSERRAESVKDFLTTQGIDAAVIHTRGMGELQPIASNGNSAGRAQNRRVEVEIDASK